MNTKTKISVGRTNKEVTIESVVYDEERRFIVTMDGQEYIFYRQDNQWHYSADAVLKDELLHAIEKQLDCIEVE